VTLEALNLPTAALIVFSITIPDTTLHSMQKAPLSKIQHLANSWWEERSQK
jgi:hypothetical protein